MNKAEDREILSAEDEKIRGFLGNLKRVEAPKDFDFRVKARIAQHSRAGFQPRFLPVLRYVLPLGLILLFSAAFVFNSVYFSDTVNVPQVAENDSPVEIKKDAGTSPANRIETTDAAALPEDETTAAAVTDSNIPKKRDEKNVPARFIAVKSVKNTKTSPKKSTSEISGGSRLSASTAPKQIITPPGINPNQTVQKSPNPANTKSLTAKEVLSQLGVESVFEDESWKVLSVRQNSPAERSGVKTGDAVQAIDGERLTDKPLRNKTIEGKNLTVRRGADKIEISLNN
ncbi:MAG TPA: PDZ domain-containing protein [Pyrinomonadaceae bacterium]|nr:PDZ domain-containing protein [Pyrinomonadaceae bacterium]